MQRWNSAGMMGWPVLHLKSWVTFAGAPEPEPGRRMRDQHGIVRTVMRQGGSERHPYIAFTDGTGIDIRWAKRMGWQIEVCRSDLPRRDGDKEWARGSARLKRRG